MNIHSSTPTAKTPPPPFNTHTSNSITYPRCLYTDILMVVVKFVDHAHTHTHTYTHIYRFRPENILNILYNSAELFILMPNSIFKRK